MANFSLSESVKIALSEAFARTFSGAIFDYDGTLTDRYYGSVPPRDLQKVCCELSQTLPLAICSARILSQLVTKLQFLLGVHFETLQKNWLLFTENGCGGYRFDLQRKEFIQFYQISWPEDRLPRKPFDEALKKFFAGKVDYISVNPSSYILRPFDYDRLSMEELAGKTDSIEQEMRVFLHSQRAHDFIEIGNSGMGVILFLKGGDKDCAAAQFGKFLELTPPYREILVVGDQPGPSGNDHRFLAGEIGTPFTVGDMVEGSDFPLPVLDRYKVSRETSGGERLTGPLATALLLKSVQFRSIS